MSFAVCSSTLTHIRGSCLTGRGACACAKDTWTRVLLVYSLVMGAALVYLAEHYALDLGVGVVCALGAYAAARLRDLLPAPSRRPVVEARPVGLESEVA